MSSCVLDVKSNVAVPMGGMVKNGSSIVKELRHFGRNSELQESKCTRGYKEKGPEDLKRMVYLRWLLQPSYVASLQPFPTPHLLQKHHVPLQLLAGFPICVCLIEYK